MVDRARQFLSYHTNSRREFFFFHTHWYQQPAAPWAVTLDRIVSMGLLPLALGKPQWLIKAEDALSAEHDLHDTQADAFGPMVQ